MIRPKSKNDPISRERMAQLSEFLFAANELDAREMEGGQDFAIDWVRTSGMFIDKLDIVAIKLYGKSMFHLKRENKHSKKMFLLSNGNEIARSIAFSRTNKEALNKLHRFFGGFFGWTGHSEELRHIMNDPNISFFFGIVPEGSKVKLPPVPKRPVRAFKIPKRAPPKDPKNGPKIILPKKIRLPPAGKYKIGQLGRDKRGLKRVQMMKVWKAKGQSVTKKQWVLVKKNNPGHK